MKQRSLLAIAGTLLIAIFVAVAFGDGWQGASHSFFASASARAGLVMLALALAWPQLVPLWKRFPPWFWGTVLLALVIVLLRPRLLLLAMGLVLAVAAIHGGIGWITKTFFRDRL